MADVLADVATFLLMQLPEDPPCCIEDGSESWAVIQYLNLRQVCGTFRRICDSPEVLLRVLFRELRDHYRRFSSDVRLRFEERFRHAHHPEAVWYEGMERLMRQRDDPVGLALVNQVAIAGDSGVAYFLAMLWYRWNPADPEAPALLHGISGGPSLPGSRWENHGLPRLRGLVRQDLHSIAYYFKLPYRDDPPELLVEDPHVCAWAECRRWGVGSFIIRYCSPECRIRHEFDLWTRHFSNRVRYAVSRM